MKQILRPIFCGCALALSFATAASAGKVFYPGDHTAYVEADNKLELVIENAQNMVVTPCGVGYSCSDCTQGGVSGACKTST